MSYNLWALIRWSEETESWRADIPYLDYFAQGRTPIETIEATREVAQTLLNNWSGAPGVLTKQWEQLLGRILLNGTPIQGYQVDSALSINDSLVVGFRVVGQKVLWPTTLVMQTLIDELFHP